MTRYHILVDGETGTILTLSPFALPTQFLMQCFPHTHCILNAHIPHYQSTKWFSKRFPLVGKKPEQYIEWSWNFKERFCMPTAPHIVTDALRAKARLATKKAEVVGTVMVALSDTRVRLMKGVDMQETVLSLKREQAKLYLSQTQEPSVFEIPFVVQYAELEHISLKEAAQRIVFKSQMDEDILLKSEFMRMKYYKKIRHAETLPQLDAIAEEFTLDLYKTAKQ
ncbi:hypothetical protein EBR66_04910 [bacterium]|nr:hypothetical protein [bacterium]